MKKNFEEHNVYMRNRLANPEGRMLTNKNYEENKNE